MGLRTRRSTPMTVSGKVWPEHERRHQRQLLDGLSAAKKAAGSADGPHSPFVIPASGGPKLPWQIVAPDRHANDQLADTMTRVGVCMRRQPPACSLLHAAKADCDIAGPCAAVDRHAVDLARLRCDYLSVPRNARNFIMRLSSIARAWSPVPPGPDQASFRNSTCGTFPAFPEPPRALSGHAKACS